jgi:hypothetical protein
MSNQLKLIKELRTDAGNLRTIEEELFIAAKPAG